MNDTDLYYFEDVAIGDKRSYDVPYEVTEREIVEMGERFDPQPFHIDPVAAKASVFGGLVASSVHVFAIWVAVGTKSKQPRSAALSALGFDKLRLRAAIRAGDSLRTRAVVKEKRLSNSRPHCGIVTMENEMYNQHDTVVFTLEHSFLIKCRAYDDAQQT